MLLDSAKITDEILNACMGEVEGAVATGCYTCTTCGNEIRVYLTVEDGVIAKAKAACDGCGYCRRCAAAAAHLAIGQEPAMAAFEVNVDRVAAAVNAAPTDNKDGPLFAVAALRLAIRNWEKGLKAAA